MNRQILSRGVSNYEKEVLKNLMERYTRVAPLRLELIIVIQCLNRVEEGRRTGRGVGGVRAEQSSIRL